MSSGTQPGRPRSALAHLRLGDAAGHRQRRLAVGGVLLRAGADLAGRQVADLGRQLRGHREADLPRRGPAASARPSAPAADGTTAGCVADGAGVAAGDSGDHWRRSPDATITATGTATTVAHRAALRVVRSVGG